MTKSEEIKDLASALAKAQAKFKPAPFDSKNPHFQNKYASLTSIIESIKGPLADNGLSFVQCIVTEGEKTGVQTTLFHSSGQFISSSFNLLIEKQNMQGLGSAITYGKRYGLSAMLGIVSDEDDDGESASRPSAKPQAPKDFTQSRPAPLIVAKPSGADPRCEFCGASMRISKNEKGYFCPNFDDKKGDHSYFKKEGLEAYMIAQASKAAP